MQMKIRESDMPKEEEWNRFFDPPKILSLLGLNQSVVDAADFGCGYGTFTIPAAKIIRGKICAFDIEPEMVETTKKKAHELNLSNVEAVQRDFVLEGSGLKGSSIDFVMLFNILHVKNPVNLLKEAHRILRPSGKLGIVNWNHDAAAPAAPSTDIRPKPGECRQWARSVGFIFEQQLDLKPHHYGAGLRKVP
jgi:SAM-dependent methyltransferase